MFFGKLDCLDLILSWQYIFYWEEIIGNIFIIRSSEQVSIIVNIFNFRFERHWTCKRACLYFSRRMLPLPMQREQACEKIGDICRSAGDLCKQQPNLAPIQSIDEGVSFKMQISWSKPIEKTVKMQKRNNYKQKNIDLFFFIKMRSTVWTKQSDISSNCRPPFFRPFAI